ncbi:unnamed protein product [Paramecium octaurelia]|uniref:Uncharacterized protein n=1 Tax=Paramecium octaurelia TaxID=43137 RepID=A0A8S1X7U6_PAROT|nr:unnamed protein product [Paramecium octaurelia]
MCKFRNYKPLSEHGSTHFSQFEHTFLTLFPQMRLEDQ